ncbi:MAG: hypothetical protein R3B45_12965 [Bdellovibrionota bacterium]
MQLIKLFILFIFIQLVTATQLMASDAPKSSNKTISLTAEVIGLSPYPISSQGARIGYIFSGGSSLLVTYFQAKKEVLQANYRYEEYELRFVEPSSSIIQIGYGIGLRKIELNYSVSLIDNEQREKLTEKFHALDANVHLGFEYPISDNFVFGSDLINLSYPFYWLKKDDRFPDNVEEFEEDPKGFPFIISGFKANLQLFRTYLTFAF